MVQWLALRRLNPVIRVQFSKRPSIFIWFTKPYGYIRVEDSNYAYSQFLLFFTYRLVLIICRMPINYRSVNLRRNKDYDNAIQIGYTILKMKKTSLWFNLFNLFTLDTGVLKQKFKLVSDLITIVMLAIHNRWKRVT